jgi:hypothetical protein
MQPPMQNTEVEAVREDEVLRAAARCVGLCCVLTCLGASTEMLGSGLMAVSGAGVGCDHAGPFDAHTSGTIDNRATAKFVTKSDEPFIAVSSRKGRDGNSIPGCRVAQFQLTQIPIRRFRLNRSNGLLT